MPSLGALPKSLRSLIFSKTSKTTRGGEALICRGTSDDGCREPRRATHIRISKRISATRGSVKRSLKLLRRRDRFSPSPPHYQRGIRTLQENSTSLPRYRRRPSGSPTSNDGELCTVRTDQQRLIQSTGRMQSRVNDGIAFASGTASPGGFWARVNVWAFLLMSELSR
jgi:hypothetical protein